MVVEIKVNRKGEVVSAKAGQQGTTGDGCLFEAAEKTAMSFKFNSDSKAIITQTGYVSINFKSN